MNFFRHKKIWLVGLYVLIRFLSFYAEPSSPLHPASPLNHLLAALFVATVGFLLVRKNDLGWYLIAGEFILGGSGNYYEIIGVSLRTILLFLGLSTFFVQRYKLIFEQRKNALIVFIMLAIAALAAAHGFLRDHSPSLVVADTIPYLLLLYYFPLLLLLRNEKWKSFCLDAIKSAIIGQSLFILLTFITFTKNWFVLQGAFYHWYRDIANGKITWVELNFYRLVLNEQLLLAPVLLYFLYQAIYKKSKEALVYIPLLLFLLSLNLTRIYMLAIAIGSLLLFSRIEWKRWLYVLLGSAAAFIIIFCSLNLISSRGRTLGLEMFGLRIQSIVTPQIEDSSLSRLLLLPKVLDVIRQNTIFGSGFGSTISVYSPVIDVIITTPHFDWGYLEIVAELGLIGLIIWLAFVYKIFTRIKKLPHWQFASLVSILIINITSPALFHVFGIIWLTFLFAVNDASAE